METDFRDGDVVWVKCGPLFWPAVVVDFNKLPPEVKEDFPVGSTKPLIVAKFFNEDGYEFLFDTKNIRPYNCSDKMSFISKGLAKSRSKSKEGAKNSWFTKFPENVIASEKLSGGDVRILEKEPFAEKPSKKIDYKAIFGSASKPVTKSAEKTPRTEKVKSEEKQSTSTPARSFSSPKAHNGQKTLSCSYCNFVTTSVSLLIIHSKGHSSGTVPIIRKSKVATPQPKKTNPSAKKSSTPKTTRSPRIPKVTSPKAGTSELVATPKRGRGRPPRSTAAIASPSPSVSESPTPGRARKPYLTKKVKEAMEQEKERKAEERNKILLDWSDEEDENGEKKAREDESGKISDYSDEETEQDYFGDDNVHGYDDDDDEEVEEDQTLEQTTNGATKTQPGPSEEAVDATQEELEKVDKDLEFDIDKILEETSVPSVLPSLEKVAKKSVKFSPVISREMSIKTIRVIEPESNLAEPEDVIDEFDYTEDSEFSEVKTPRTILKRISSSGNEDEPKKIRIEEPSTPSPIEEKSTPVQEHDLNTDEVAEKSNEPPFQAHLLLQTDEGQQIQVSNGGETAQSGDTFFLVVDDESGSSNLEALNSQTLYIDSNSLENGDLSNMLLMANGVQGENQVVSLCPESTEQLTEQDASQAENQS